jgi:hypothetical protein
LSASLRRGEIFLFVKRPRQLPPIYNFTSLAAAAEALFFFRA